jgi:hypothetical protein
VLRTMIGAMGGSDVLTPISMRELAAKTHYPFATIQRLMQDLAALQIIRRHGAGSVSTWTLSDYVRKEVQDAELYVSTDISAQSSGRIRLVRRRVKPHARKIRIPLGKINATTTGSKITLNLSSNGSGIPVAPEPVAPAPPVPRPPSPAGEGPARRPPVRS